MVGKARAHVVPRPQCPHLCLRRVCARVALVSLAALGVRFVKGSNVQTADVVLAARLEHTTPLSAGHGRGR